MKKLIIVLGCFLFCLSFTGCGNKSTYVKEVNNEELQKMIAEGKSFVLEVMSTDCSACKDFSPKLANVTNQYKVTVYQLNVKNMKDEDWDKFSETYSVSSTPTTMFFTTGKEETVATRIVGSVSEDKIISKFKTMGYIQAN